MVKGTAALNRLLALAGAGALTMQIASAMAADMPPPVAEPVPVVSLNSGWYLRGDVGYNWGRLSGAQSAVPFPDPTGSSLDSNFMAGVGFGFKRQWLRADVTVDYAFPMDYTGTIAAPDDVTAKISAASALFNGYLDLGTWHGVTPYLGAGAGVAYVNASDYASTAAPPFSGNTSNAQWNFAWALMAGFGVAVSPNLVVDVGYRYIDFGDVETAQDAFGGMTFKDVAAHEVRLGVRWSFDDNPIWR